MTDCKGCIHEAACRRWIDHGNLLYDDFDYSTEDCPDYAPKCKACVHCEPCTNWRGKEYLGCTWLPCETHEVDADHFCAHGERRKE